MSLRSGRILLRQWRDEDWEPFADLNADPAVMEHFPALMTADESRALLDRCRDHIGASGWGLWAVEIPGAAPFAGFTDSVPCHSMRLLSRWSLRPSFNCSRRCFRSPRRRSSCRLCASLFRRCSKAVHRRPCLVSPPAAPLMSGLRAVAS